ncbi:MAG: IPT/TIG domain-containing protein [Dehalococcoidia bacterium]|nr:IPT/TIG domain-containing protein [Dehalococcoidia bacterium]
MVNSCLDRLLTWRVALLAVLALGAVPAMLLRPVPAAATNCIYALGAGTYSGTSGTTVPITVTRTGEGCSGTSIVTLDYQAITAVPGADYAQPGQTTLTFLSGDTSKTRNLEILAGAGIGKTLRVTLTASAPDFTGSPSSAIITINPSTGPTITSVTPASGGLNGGPITIRGTNLGSVTTVSVLRLSGDDVSITCSPMTVVDSTTITCNAPGGRATSGAADVQVLGGNGNFTLPGGYYYTNGPFITSVTPNNGVVSGGTPVTITGGQFPPGCGTVRFGVATVPVCTFTDSGHLQVTAPASAGAAKVHVTVTDTVTARQSPQTNDDYYTYSGGPTVSAVSPNAGPPAGGNTVTVSGSGYQVGNTQVYFGTAASTNVVVAGSNSLTAVVPAGTPGTVTVRVRVGLFDSADAGTLDDYTYSGTALVTSVENSSCTASCPPASGPTTGGTLVRIKGQNFTEPFFVKFGTVVAPLGTVSLKGSTEITVQSPPQPAGSVPVTVVFCPPSPAPFPCQNGIETGNIGIPGQFSYTAATPPTITSLSPSNGPVGGGNVITVFGSGFFGGGVTAVTFGGANVPVAYTGSAAGTNVIVSDTQIKVTVPARATAGTVEVTVTTLQGTSAVTGTANDYQYGAAAGSTVTYSLYPGFSLITWAGGDNLSIFSALHGTESPDNPATNDVASSVGAVYTWSANGAGCRNGEPACWLGYFPGANVPGANDMTTFRQGTAYWIAVYPGTGTVAWVVAEA